MLESGTTAELRNLKCQVRSIFEQRDAEIAGLARENARLRAEVAGHAAALLESAVRRSRLLSVHRPTDALTLLLNDALVALDMGAIKMVHDECHLERFRDRVTP
ncbi:MAG: hypothetical protein HZA24_00300 [Nitrospirae bacterium]|nr:hypothetical protein [Nitrospirota bacterium]